MKEALFLFKFVAAFSIGLIIMFGVPGILFAIACCGLPILAAIAFIPGCVFGFVIGFAVTDKLLEKF
jgi:putative flippase GtrA